MSSASLSYDALVTPQSPEDIEWGRWLFAQLCNFVWGVQKLSDLPDFSLPEVGFAGRSNVGKSSLINALTNRSSLARTSHTPGRTQQLNYFKLGERLHLVDMPGYGYAAVSKKMIENWSRLIKTYLRGRPNLHRIYLLIDARQGLKSNDIESMKLMDETAVSYQIVLTKADKTKPAALQSLINSLQETLIKHPAAHPHVLPTSSVSGFGIPELRAEIAKFAQK
jgi:GTP-binding protein